FCFFFFQAEDGIRDGHVTGVQTCALPISESRHTRGRGGRTVAQGRAGELRACVYPRGAPGQRLERDAHGGAARHRAEPPLPKARSEERRVGKEGKRWGGQYMEKKRKSA